MEVKEIQAEFGKATEEIKGLLAKQDSEIKSNGESTAKTAAELKAAGDRLAQIEAEKKSMEDRLSGVEAKMNRPQYSAGGGELKATPGMQFVMSDEYKAAQAGGVPRTNALEVGNMFGLKTIADSTRGDGTDRAPVHAEQVPELGFDPGQRQMTIRGLMNVAPTASNSIEHFRETGAFDAGSAAAQDGETNTKRQMKMNFEKLTATVETIAAWLPASRQVLDDQAQLQSHIDTRLIYKVLKEMEDQVIFGDGTSGNLLGIHNTPGVQTIGAPAGTDTVIDHIRKAFAAVRASEYMATGIILHPNDWAEIELTKGSDDHYIWVSVPDGGVSRLWRVPVVESTVMEEGRFLTGAFGIGAQLWDRQQATIRIAEQHEDYFIRNALVVLAELRVALTVYRPQAFVKGTLSDTLST
jgi:HK97 family phage major capsid protein